MLKYWGDSSVAMDRSCVFQAAMIEGAAVVVPRVTLAATASRLALGPADVLPGWYRRKLAHSHVQR